MIKYATVKMGEVAVDKNPMRLKTHSVGSCLVIVLYDDQAKVGGLAHAILPKRPKKDQESEIAAKYVDEAIDCLIAEIAKLGGKQQNLRAKLIGGARMFRILSGDKFGIGYQNVKAARERLSQLSIPIEREEVGSTVGRIAEMDLANGQVEVLTKM